MNTVLRTWDACNRKYTGTDALSTKIDLERAIRVAKTFEKRVIYRILKRLIEKLGKIEMQRFKLSTKMISLGLVCIICVTLVLVWVYFKISTIIYC